jgi:endonuclease/exonuclease/phosphatase family metal-dependent hydrolase
MNGGLYTWSNNQDPPVLEKLDRILVSKSWEDLFPHALVRKLPREVSNHNPLIVTSGTPKKS